MSEYQRRNQSEQGSPALDQIRNSSIFQSNTTAFENSSRLEQLRHLRNSGAMCLPGQADFMQSTWYQAQVMGQNTMMDSHDHESEHNHETHEAHETEAPTPEPVITPLEAFLPLQVGSRGEGVRILQEQLNTFGAGLVADGAYGQKTADAVEIFQVANQVSRSGTVDKATAEALYKQGARNLQDARLDGVPGQFVGTFEAWQGGQHIGDIDVVELDGKKVAVKTARAWETLKNAAAADGVHLQLNSGFRTMPEQRHLYQKYGAPRAATPGYSNHQHGQALDIDASNPDHKRWLFDNAPGFGWRNTVSFEPWHWEYFGD